MSQHKSQSQINQGAENNSSQQTVNNQSQEESSTTLKTKQHAQTWTCNITAITMWLKKAANIHVTIRENTHFHHTFVLYECDVNLSKMLNNIKGAVNLM